MRSSSDPSAVPVDTPAAPARTLAAPTPTPARRAASLGLGLALVSAFAFGGSGTAAKPLIEAGLSPRTPSGCGWPGRR